jgi:hypothetical protein
VRAGGLVGDPDPFEAARPGEAVRAIATTQPVGERLVEVRLGRDSTFDAWVRGEWVREEAFRSFEQALRRAPRLLREYLMTARAEPIG